MNRTSIEQERAIASNAANLLTVAGPGSGKTFTLVSRIRRLINGGVAPEKVAVMTFTNAAARELEERLRKGFFEEKPVPLGFTGTLHSFLFRILTRYGERIGLNPPLVVVDEDQRTDLLMTALEEISWRGTTKAVEEAVAQGPGRTHESHMTKVDIAAAAFYQKLKDEGLLTFDMVLHFGRKLIESGRLGQKELPYTHLFVDEFQDSGDEDAMIYDALPIANKFYVGDPDQAIYSFRGGNVANIVSMAVRSQNVELHKLEGNYRCGSAICEAAQRLIEHAGHRVAKATVSMTNTTGTICQCPPAETGDREAVALNEDILARVRAGVHPKEMAVLARTNWLVGELSRALKGYGIPVRERRKTERPDDWQRAKMTLSLLNNPDNDRLAYMAVLIGAGKEKADEVRRYARSEFKSMNEIALKLPYNLPPAEALQQLVRMNISRQSIELLSRFAKTLPADGTLADLVLAISREELQQEEDGDGVTITTMHAAKGREWQCVWLPAIEHEIIPSRRKGVNVDEERRLLYVAMTRAKDYLWLSWSKERRQQFGSPRVNTPSQFLAELQS